MLSLKPSHSLRWAAPLSCHQFPISYTNQLNYLNLPVAADVQLCAGIVSIGTRQEVLWNWYSSALTAESLTVSGLLQMQIGDLNIFIQHTFHKNHFAILLVWINLNVSNFSKLYLYSGYLGLTVCKKNVLSIELKIPVCNCDTKYN